MSFGRAFRLVALALGGVTVVLGVVCGVLTFRTHAFLTGSSTAPGRVVGLVERESCDHSDDREDGRQQVCSSVYAPRVTFTTADGRTVVFESRTASSPASYAEGDRVQVRYRAEDAVSYTHLTLPTKA